MSEDSMLAELGLDKNMCFKEEIRYISFHECLLINKKKKKNIQNTSKNCTDCKTTVHIFTNAALLKHEVHM